MSIKVFCLPVQTAEELVRRVEEADLFLYNNMYLKAEGTITFSQNLMGVVKRYYTVEAGELVHLYNETLLQ